MLEIELETESVGGVKAQIQKLGGSFWDAEQTGFTVVGVKDPHALAKIKQVLKKSEIRFRNRIGQDTVQESDKACMSVEVERRYWDRIKLANHNCALTVKNSTQYNDRCVISFKQGNKHDIVRYLKDNNIPYAWVTSTSKEEANDLATNTMQVYVPETMLANIESWIGKGLKPLPTNFVNTVILIVSSDQLSVLNEKQVPYCDANQFDAKTMLRIARYTPLDSLQEKVVGKLK